MNNADSEQYGPFLILQGQVWHVGGIGALDNSDKFDDDDDGEEVGGECVAISSESKDDAVSFDEEEEEFELFTSPPKKKLLSNPMKDSSIVATESV